MNMYYYDQWSCVQLFFIAKNPPFYYHLKSKYIMIIPNTIIHNDHMPWLLDFGVITIIIILNPAFEAHGYKLFVNQCLKKHNKNLYGDKKVTYFFLFKIKLFQNTYVI